MDAKFVSGASIKRQFNISTQSLHRWEEEGKISSIRTPGGNRLYSTEDLARIFGIKHPCFRSKVCYARVSSDHQKEDLQRQIEILKREYPAHEIIFDIGSGLNFKRKGFLSLLERVYAGSIEEIVVLYKDRLCRFGEELVEFICQQADCKILVHSDSDRTPQNSSEELSEDLLSVVTVFVARNNGLRAGQNRKRREEKSQKLERNTGSTEETPSSKMHSDSSLPDQISTKNSESVV